MNKRFLNRQADGTARVRLKFVPKEASLIEEAAGTVPVLTWLHQTINNAAAEQVKQNRAQRTIAPPKEQA